MRKAPPHLRNYMITVVLRITYVVMGLKGGAGNYTCNFKITPARSITTGALFSSKVKVL